MKIYYIAIPLITLIVAVGGSQLTAGGMGWYKTLILPDLAPSGGFIGAVWTIIFILSTISALLFWQKMPRGSRFNWITVLFLLNAFLNVFWSYLFFTRHLLAAPIAEMIFLEITVIALIFLLWPKIKSAALLLVPYAIWVAFATYLAFSIWQLNV